MPMVNKFHFDEEAHTKPKKPDLYVVHWKSLYDVMLFMFYSLSKFLIYYLFICIFHSTRINLRAMILRGSAGRFYHLENVKSYMSYLQQYTKIIKMLTLKTYFRSI